MQQSLVSLDYFVFEQNSGSKITWLRLWHWFWKALLSKCSSSTLKWKACIFKLLRSEENFLKLGFCDGFMWPVGLTAEINLYLTVWTWPEKGYQDENLIFKNKPGIHDTGASTALLLLIRWAYLIRSSEETIPC